MLPVGNTRFTISCEKHVQAESKGKRKKKGLINLYQLLVRTSLCLFLMAMTTAMVEGERLLQPS